MTTNEKNNGGFYRYPAQITLGTRLTKADVERRKELYQQSLDKKWYLIQKGNKDWGGCAFCEDMENSEKDCKQCKIAPALCQNNGFKGLYFQWAQELNKIKRHVLANQMVAAMEARIHDCEVILKAMAQGGYEEIIDSERIV